MSNVSIVATQDGRMYRKRDTADYIELYVTQMDQNWCTQSVDNCKLHIRSEVMEISIPTVIAQP